VLVVIGATRDSKRHSDADVKHVADADRDTNRVAVDECPCELLRPAPQVEFVR